MIRIHSSTIPQIHDQFIRKILLSIDPHNVSLKETLAKEKVTFYWDVQSEFPCHGFYIFATEERYHQFLLEHS